MGHIAEPKNVDLIIESPPLSDKERKEISEFIGKLKTKNKTFKSTTKYKKEQSRTPNSN